MDSLWKQVRIARRRLNLQQFLAALGWSWFAALVIAAVVVAVDKYARLGVEAWGAVVAALVVGALMAVAWTVARRTSSLAAALEIDRRFKLRERVSSTLALSPDQRESIVGQALVRDAAARVEKIDVPDQFALRLGRWSWLPLLPGIALFLIATLVEPWPAAQQAQARTAQDNRPVKTSTSKLKARLAERREQAKKAGLKDAADLFGQLEKGAEELSRADDLDRKESLVKLNDLARDLAKRRDELGGAEKLREQLKKLKSLSGGPGDKFAQALGQGDFKQALQEIQKLRDQLNQGQLDKDAQRKLAEQLAEMQKKLEKLAEAHEQAKRDLDKQIAEKKAAGKNDEAAALEEKRNALERQNKSLEAMSKMAEKLANAQKSLEQGDNAKAGQQLDAMQAELAEMAKQLDEAEALEAALDEIADAKDAMACQECQGEGCAACRAAGRPGQNRFGRGMGEGRGSGERPEERTDTGQYDTKVNQKVGRGSAVATGMVEGPNIRGQVQAEINAEFEAAAAAESDPLTDQPLPADARDHARRYFDALRDGK